MARNRSHRTFVTYLLCLFVCLATVTFWTSNRRHTNSLLSASADDINNVDDKTVTSLRTNHPPFIIKTRPGEGQESLETRNFMYQNENEAVFVDRNNDSYDVINDVIHDTRNGAPAKLVFEHGRLRSKRPGRAARHRDVSEDSSDGDEGRAANAKVKPAKRSADNAIPRLTIYGAYYDDRKEPPLLYIFAVNTKKMPSVMYCIFETDHPNSGRDVMAYAEHRNLPFPQRKVVKNDKRYMSSMFTCKFPNRRYNLTRVRLLAKDEGFISDSVAIVYPAKPAQYEHEFGLCVLAQFGFISNDRVNALIEWFELHQLLGVSEFSIYDSALTLDADVVRVMRYYVDKGVLRHVMHPPPFTHSDDAESVRLLIYSSLNDCLYRNMYRYRFLMAVDLDEIIVPATLNSYNDMMHSFSAYPNISLKFNSANYFLEYTRDDTQPSLLPAMQYRKFSRNRSVQRPKVIHNLRNCDILTQHKCEPITAKLVPESVGTVHHYRAHCVSLDHTRHQTWSQGNCTILAQNTETDNAVLRFKNELISTVSSVHTALGLL